jgi:hypothetical protein
MEQVLINFIIATIKSVPDAIAAVKRSQTMSEEEKRLALTQLTDEVDIVAAHVEAVVFQNP